MKRGGSDNAIMCYHHFGPVFGCEHYDSHFYDLIIVDKCNEKHECFTRNNGMNEYECHPRYKASLFVNSKGNTSKNHFSVLDYEVFCIDNYHQYLCDKCRYPDILYEYAQTKDISEDSLKMIDDDIQLLSDLNVIHCSDSTIRVKISQLCLKNPSQFLPDTQLVGSQYDTVLREWLGSDSQWKLLYRASEHGYTGESFHKCCDNQGPTLIIIKSTGGWIFGGYTSIHWTSDSI